MADRFAQRLLRKHPLQRLPSPSRGVSALFHILVLLSFGYSYQYLIYNPTPINESYGWHLQYLTIIGLTLSTVTFAVGLLADITLSRRLFRLKNILSVGSAPMECLITLLYWGLRAYDTKLVLPEWADPLALHSDLSFHAVPAIGLVLDLLFFSPPYTIAFLPSLALSFVIAFVYWLWIEHCFHFNDFYPYPIFAILTTSQRIGLFAFSALLMAISTGGLVWLYSVVNGNDYKKEYKGDPKKARSGDVKGLR